jgi:hypothetical protein
MLGPQNSKRRFKKHAVGKICGRISAVFLTGQKVAEFSLKDT